MDVLDVAKSVLFRGQGQPFVDLALGRRYYQGMASFAIVS